MKKNILIIVIFTVLLFITSCNKVQETSENADLNSEVEKDIISEEKENNENSKEAETDITKDEGKIVSPLDGLKYDQSALNKRPVVISIDNHPEARWQAGLSQAEIIYECEVEGSYTRYLCVFLAKEPEMIGPVRSARPYLVYYALENDGIFVHVGGSQQAFNDIYNLNAADIDGLYSNSMYRYYDTKKQAPHNVYTTLEKVRNAAKNKGYRETGNFEGYKFNSKSSPISLVYEKLNVEIIKAEIINIVYNKHNTTDYSYDSEKKLYLRFKDKDMHIDELNNEQLTTKNILIIQTSKQVLDSEGRIYLGTVGKGKGIYVSEGEAVAISWEKASEKERTKFYLNGEELTLNPGNTWIQVVSNIKNVSIK